MPSILIESAKLLIGDELTTANIFVDDGVIRKISKLRPVTNADIKIDASRFIALPGLIDAHVHLRDLESSYKETFETGTRAAAVGGFTTVLDMPNSRPPTINAANLADKMTKANGRMFSNVGFQGALVDNPDEIKRMDERGAIAFKLYLNKSLVTFDSSNSNAMLTAMRAAKESNSLVTVHAEDGDTIKKIQESCIKRGDTSVRDFLKAHTPYIEVSAVRNISNLGAKIGLRLHICHITVPEAVRIVRRTPNASCEATPHHLLLNQSILRTQKTLAICVPPIRSERERSGLWKSFAKGQIDIMGSDHAPHTLEEKTSDNAWNAAPGVPGLETSLPVLFTQVAKRRLPLRRLIEAASTLPARLFRLPRKGALQEGYDADIVLVDPKAKTRVNPETFQSKAKYSPFKGYPCIGRAAYTIVNGNVVAESGRIVGPPVGRQIKSEKTWASS